jgi:hypothetical protein
MTFYTRNTTDASWIERMRITETGSIALSLTTSHHIIRRNSQNGSWGIKIQANTADAVSDTNPGAAIVLGGGSLTDTYEGSIDLIAYGAVADSNRNQIKFSNRSGVNTVTERMRIDHKGNVGIGVIPNTSWYESSNVIQMGAASAIEARTNTNLSGLYTNIYSTLGSSALTFINGNSAAMSYTQYAGTHYWRTSYNTPAANAAVSYYDVMQLSAAGNLTIYGSHLLGPSTGANSLGINLYNNPDAHGTGTEGSQLTLGGAAAFAVKWYRLNTFNAGYLSFQTHVGGVFAGERCQLNAYGAFVPTTDNNGTIGASSQRWSAIWSANGTIQTSDQRAKTEITNSQLGLTFINSLRPVSYKWKVGGKDVRTDFEAGKDEAGNYTQIVTDKAGNRTHFGLIAQEVKQALGTQDFGGYVYDENTDTYALRYDQFVSPLIKAVQELSQQVEALKAELAALK